MGAVAGEAGERAATAAMGLEATDDTIGGRRQICRWRQTELLDRGMMGAVGAASGRRAADRTRWPDCWRSWAVGDGGRVRRRAGLLAVAVAGWSDGMMGVIANPPSTTCSGRRR
ncbi:hypothetical protein ACLOJK_038835 [Asimina triloba]